MTDYIARRSLDQYLFIPRLFQGFPEIKEALISNRVQAGFLVAPLAVALRSQGVPIKIVFLGHRYGSAAVVKQGGPVKTVADLKGKTMAVPSRFSDERLLLLRALEQHGVRAADVRIVEMPPADVAAALASNAIDGFVMGEPFPSQAEMGGYGRVLFHAREYWPDYLSCVLVVREDVIQRRPEAVQVLVDGIARSGLWLDSGQSEREYAAEFVGRYYYNQPPSLLKWALTRPLDRVRFNPLLPRRDDFELVTRLMLENKLIDEPIAFEEYVDPRFAEGAAYETAWDYPVGAGRLDPEKADD
ncbi:ABC transporter substrate-binding protein [Cystobacter fuscus]|uniref:ABC transporter substrate-binding protein n=1 Tax=Cystobacter fuscus TaxID=43 RepID=UPI000BB3B2BD|nr:ABC transporter substrate-binding protein [Cystobacter fuscus]